MAAREQSGIYTITHLATGRLYVGQSHGMRGRMSAHRAALRRGKHANRKLQAAFDAYGEAAFAFEVLESYEVRELDAMEQYWINVLQPAFNLAPMAGVMRGYRFTDEQRAAMRSAFAKPETKLARSQARKAMWDQPGFRERASARAVEQLTGKKQPPEHVCKRTAWQAGKPRDADFRARVSAGKLASGFRFSEESRRKMSASRTGKKQSPETIAKRMATIATKRASAEVRDGS